MRSPRLCHPLNSDLPPDGSDPSRLRRGQFENSPTCRPGIHHCRAAIPGNIHDTIDDRIDVVAGLITTVNCARHDQNDPSDQDYTGFTACFHSNGQWLQNQFADRGGLSNPCQGGIEPSEIIRNEV